MHSETRCLHAATVTAGPQASAQGGHNLDIGVTYRDAAHHLNVSRWLAAQGRKLLLKAGSDRQVTAAPATAGGETATPTTASGSRRKLFVPKEEGEEPDVVGGRLLCVPDDHTYRACTY